MDIRILGPLEVLEDGRALELGGTKQRAVLAMLALHANRVVSLDQLSAAVWDDEPPESARKALQVYVSQLRKVVGHERLQTKGGGYMLRLGADELDLARFDRLRSAGEAERALALWRGPALSDLSVLRFAQTEAARLDELRLSCLEDRFEWGLAAGRHAEIAGELEALAREHPHREHLHAELMLALYRSGRQADALAAYQRVRSALVSDLGLEPGAELRDLHQQILRQDPLLHLPQRGISKAPAPERSADRETAAMRKTVTVLFCDLVSSTSLGERLDPEALRGVMTTWFEAMRIPIERAGGTVEKFVGDAVMAVFGVPTVHEDDAFRAVQAALEMQAAVATLDLEVRIGLNTGEVMTGDGATTLVTGDAVNTAKRLQEAAQPGETLIGSVTRRLVANATELVPVDPVAARGKRSPVEAWRVVSTIAGATPFARRLDVALVDRVDELAFLESELDEALQARGCRIVTVHAPAGVGKSRLAEELVARAGHRVQALTARCVPYGDGITFLPLRELLATVGEEQVASAGSNEEIFLAVRRVLERIALDRPLLLRLEDVHWAQPAFLDLVEYLVGWSKDAPMLLVCLARPELYDVRPRWPGAAVALEPLGDTDSVELLEELTAEWPLDPDSQARIVDVAEGNPLYLEQLVAMLSEGGEAPAMPPTIQALLTARLDRLDTHEQAILQRAAVAGRDFSRGAVIDLSPVDERADVGATLLSLVRKELVRPARSDDPEEDAFRFRHALIRDAAYGEIPKRIRAELHERFASRLERREATDELVGYHLEQAYRCGLEIGAPNEATAARAGALLAAAGRRAYARDDIRAAVSLLGRAAGLLPPDDPGRADVLIVRGSALMSAGAFGAGREALVEGRDLARAVGDRRLEIRAVIELEFHAALTGTAASTAEIVAVAEDALPVLEELGDDTGLARVWRLISEAHVIASRWEDRTTALERALRYAQRAGDRRQQSSIIALLAQALHYGPTPADEAIARCEELLADAPNDRALSAALMSTLGGLYAMLAEFDRARSLWLRSRELYEELGLEHRRAARSLIPATIELLAGDPVAAERELRLGYETLAAMGETYVRATLAAFLAAVLAELGRTDEAIALSRESEANTSEDDVVTQVVWRGARARALSETDPAQAAALAQEAVDRALATDFIDLRAGALLVLAAVGNPSAAARAVVEYELKGNVVGAGRARALATV